MLTTEFNNRQEASWSRYDSPSVNSTPSISGATIVSKRWKAIQDRLLSLTQYRSGWDAHDATPVDPALAIFSLNVIGPMIRAGLPEPFIAPLAYGGLQYEWHRGGTVLELEIRAPYDVLSYYEADSQSEPEESEFQGTDMKELAIILERAGQKFDIAAR
jgi:hypothetical protein